jgi:hypothetical protein
MMGYEWSNGWFMSDSFNFHLHNSHRSPFTPTFQITNHQYRFLVLDRLKKMMGLQLSQRSMSRFLGTSEWNSDTPIELVDLLEIGERVKHTNVVANAEGFFYQCKALSVQQPNFKLELLSQALERFEGLKSWD